MSVSSPLMVVIGLLMMYRLIARRAKMQKGVFVFWLILFAIITVLAALKTAGLLPSLA